MDPTLDLFQIRKQLDDHLMETMKIDHSSPGPPSTTGSRVFSPHFPGGETNVCSGVPYVSREDLNRTPAASREVSLGCAILNGHPVG